MIALVSRQCIRSLVLIAQCVRGLAWSSVDLSLEFLIISIRPLAMMTALSRVIFDNTSKTYMQMHLDQVMHKHH